MPTDHPTAQPVPDQPVTVYFSFGHGQTDPDTGENLIDKYVTITGPSYEACREAMFASRYGNRWSFDYVAGTALAEAWIPRWTEHDRLSVDPAQWAALQDMPATNKLETAVLVGKAPATQLLFFCSACGAREDEQHDDWCPNQADIHPALRSQLDEGLASAVDALLAKAAEHDGKDIVEANVDLTNWLLAQLSVPQLAAAAASLALRLHRNGGAR